VGVVHVGTEQWTADVSIPQCRSWWDWNNGQWWRGEYQLTISVLFWRMCAFLCVF